ncbi:MAG: conserved phage C-terminal domain-containing protein [Gammaproteobacteria bacterium]
MDLFSRFEEFIELWNTCTHEERDRIRTFVLNGEMPAAATDDVRGQAREILRFLNERTGQRFRDTDVNLKFITARLREGYTVTQCRQVIVRKCRDWLDTDRAEYLRPATLFNASKFNQYVGQLVAAPAAESVKHADRSFLHAVP